MKKKLFIVLFLFLSVFCLYRNVYAEENFVPDYDTSQYDSYEHETTTDIISEKLESGFSIIIDDKADLLSEEEEAKLKEEMVKLTEFGNIAFVSISDNYTSASNFADSYYHNSFGTESGSLFLIDMDNRQIYIFSDGYNYSIITNSKANIITDNIYSYASYEHYYDCAYNAFDQMNTLLSGGKIFEPMRHASNAVLAVVLAFLINFIIVLVNSSVRKASNNEIINTCDVSFTASNIVGRNTGTHRVYSPQSSSSGGSGGGGGGGHSGGGGGHGF